MPELRPPLRGVGLGFQVGQEEQPGGQQHRDHECRTGRQKGPDCGGHNHQEHQCGEEAGGGEQHLPGDGLFVAAAGQGEVLPQAGVGDAAAGQLPGHPYPHHRQQPNGARRARFDRSGLRSRARVTVLGIEACQLHQRCRSGTREVRTTRANSTPPTRAPSPIAAITGPLPHQRTRVGRSLLSAHGFRWNLVVVRGG